MVARFRGAHPLKTNSGLSLENAPVKLLGLGGQYPDSSTKLSQLANCCSVTAEDGSPLSHLDDARD